MVKRKGDIEDFEIPFWKDISDRTYQKINRLARKHEITRADLIEAGLKAFENELKSRPMRKAGASGEAVKAVFGGYAKTWWDSLSPEQRAIEAAKRIKAANIRWGNKTKKKSA